MITRLLVITTGSVVFGVVDALLYHHAGTFWLANLAAAYLTLAFAVGMATGSCGLFYAGVAGAGATVLALVTFYVTQVHQHIGGPSFDRVRFARYALPGAFSGFLFGVLGVRWARRRSWWALALLAVALSMEPTAWRWRLGYEPGSAWTWTLERTAGLAVALVSLASAVRKRVRAQRAVTTDRQPPS